MGMNKGMYTSNSCEWETPLDFFKVLDAEFHFDVDVCATPENAKCTEYYTKADDGGVPRTCADRYRLVA